MSPDPEDYDEHPELGFLETYADAGIALVVTLVVGFCGVVSGLSVALWKAIFADTPDKQ